MCRHLGITVVEAESRLLCLDACMLMSERYTVHLASVTYRACPFGVEYRSISPRCSDTVHGIALRIALTHTPLDSKIDSSLSELKRRSDNCSDSYDGHNPSVVTCVGVAQRPKDCPGIVRVSAGVLCLIFQSGASCLMHPTSSFPS